MGVAVVDSSDLTVSSTPVECKAVNSAFTGCTDEKFETIFVNANRAAWNDVVTDDKFKLDLSGHGHVLVDVASSLSPYYDELCSPEYSILTDSLKSNFVKLSGTFDVDSVISTVHSMRLSNEISSKFIRFVNSHKHSVSEHVCKMLFNVWLRRLITQLASKIREECCSLPAYSSMLPEPLSVSDQNVLYYVAGYLAYKIKMASKYKSNLKSADSLIAILATKYPSQQSHFVDSYNSWMKKQNRGGLLYPVPDFYLMTREMDNIYRLSVRNFGVSATCVNKHTILQQILESHMINYYWKRLLASAQVNELASRSVLLYIVSLFVTVKSFAIVKKERSRLIGKHELGTSKSKSLRGNLKKK